MESSSAPRRPTLSLPIVLAVLCFAATLLDITVLGDADTYWHVEVGRWITEHRAVPRQDVWSHSWPGIAWTAHEWLSELLMYAVFNAGGWTAVQLIMNAAFAMTAGYILHFALRRMSRPSALALCLVCLGVMSTHFLARPHVLVWPLTAVWVGTLVDAGEQHRAPPWWLLLLLIVWCNLHASFTLGLGFAGALALDAWYAARSDVARLQLIRRWMLFLAAAGLCALVNPRGLDAISHALGVMRMSATLDIVTEWKSADFHQFQFLLVWLFLVTAVAFTGHLKLSPIRIIFILGLLYLALKHRRYHALVGLVSPFLLAKPLGDGLREGDSAALPDSHPASALGVALGAAVCVVLGLVMRPYMRQAPNPYVTPAGAVEAFQATGATGNVFNTYAFGGYLISRGVPVYIDGRGDMYGDAFMTETADARDLKSPQALETVLRKYRIGWTLLQPDVAAVALLDHLSGWQRIYGDSVAVVHVRRDLLDAARMRTTPSGSAVR